MTILKIAEIIKEKTGAKIKIEASKIQVLRQNSDKLILTGLNFNIMLIMQLKKLLLNIIITSLEDKEIYYNLKVDEKFKVR